MNIKDSPKLFLLALIVGVLLSACGGSEEDEGTKTESVSNIDIEKQVVENYIPLNDTGMSSSDFFVDGWGNRHLDTCPPEFQQTRDCSRGRDFFHDDDSDGFAGFSFSKLDQNGKEIPKDSTTWSCARDNVTGLVWQVPAIDLNSVFYWRKKFHWYDPDETANGGAAGTQRTGECEASDVCNTHELIKKANDIALCGWSDWRLPDIQELRSIVIYDTNHIHVAQVAALAECGFIGYFPSPVYFDTKFLSPHVLSDFENVRETFFLFCDGFYMPYWTSTPSFQSDKAYVFGDKLNSESVFRDHNRFDQMDKTLKAHVRLVRGPATNK